MHDDPTGIACTQSLEPATLVHLEIYTTNRVAESPLRLQSDVVPDPRPTAGARESQAGQGQPARAGPARAGAGKGVASCKLLHPLNCLRPILKNFYQALKGPGYVPLEWKPVRTKIKLR